MKIPRFLKNKRIAVLYGGFSDERSISLKTGAAVLAGLKRLGLSVIGIDADSSLSRVLEQKKINYVVIALHGRWGEDGCVQGVCEWLKIPYWGSGVLASAAAMHKYSAKKIFSAAGLATAPAQLVKSVDEKIKIALPVVVKPEDGGSAIGVFIVKKVSQLKPALKQALRLGGTALVEKYIEGVEITAPVLGERALPLIKILPKRAFYDFKAKYEKGMSQHETPARISSSLAEKIKNMAVTAHQALGCCGFSRSDFIVDKSGKPWILETNTLPGMTETSLFPESAASVGIAFDELLLEMILASARG